VGDKQRVAEAYHSRPWLLEEEVETREEEGARRRHEEEEGDASLPLCRFVALLCVHVMYPRAKIKARNVNPSLL